MPEAGAQHGHEHDIASARGGPCAGPSGVSTVSATVGTSRSASAAEQHADPSGQLPKSFRRRLRVAQLQQDVLHERMIDEVNHGARAYRRVEFRQC